MKDFEALEPRKLLWEKVNWQNTHMEGLDGRDIYHVGSEFNASDGDLVILRLGSDADDEPHFTIILTADQAQDMATTLRLAAR